MARIAPLKQQDLPQCRQALEAIERDHGYVPNSFLTMARVPALLQAQDLFAQALWYGDELTPQVRHLVAYAFSVYNGAMYSAAHTACAGAQPALAVAKLQQILRAEPAEMFDACELALLELCRAAARQPSEVTDAHWRRLRLWFDERQLFLITGLIAWHSFLNTWNTTMRTELEAQPRSFAQTHLRAAGWSGERHV